MRKIVIAYHVFMFGNKYKQMITDQLTSLVKFGLFEVTDKLFIGVNIDKDVPEKEAKDWLKTFLFPNKKKVEIVYFTENKEISSTLKWVKDYSKENTDDYVLFLHTKGITKQNAATEDWRKYMEYFVIENWKDCITKLDEWYDCCGVMWNIDTTMGMKPHFSGGMFWTTTKYINTLDHTYLDSELRYDQEFWIGTNPSAKVYEFHNSHLNDKGALQIGVCHYSVRYPRENYVKKEDKAKLHIICTSYERPLHLQILINSFLVQTRLSWELYIIHDGKPSEAITKVINSYSDNRIHFTYTEKRNQQYGHPNRKLLLEQVKVSEHDFILITNDDNYYVPVFVEWMMSVVSNNTGIVFCNTVHSLMKYELHHSKLRENGIDMGCFIVRGSIAKKVGFNNTHYSADGAYATECKRYSDNRNYEIRYIAKPLFVHN